MGPITLLQMRKLRHREVKLVVQTSSSIGLLKGLNPYKAVGTGFGIWHMLSKC